jgi:hypothetical protein
LFVRSDLSGSLAPVIEACLSSHRRSEPPGEPPVEGVSPERPIVALVLVGGSQGKSASTGQGRGRRRREVTTR